MPSHRRKNKEEEDLEDLVTEELPEIEPYTVLGLEKTATADEVKSAYRKAALKHHPDKSPEHLKDEAHKKFQDVAFAYAVLSDPVRRKRYDVTGSTLESVNADGFSWSEFYSEQFRDVVTSEAIETFSKGYKNSDEEKDDLLNAYTKAKGKWSGIYETVMLSDPLGDEDRFREIIDKAISSGDAKAYKAYTDETEKSKENRMKSAKKEGTEAMEYAKELGVHDKLFSKGSVSKQESSEDSLAALIAKRHAGRGGSFLDHLEAKYANENKKPRGRKGKKRASEDEAEEEGMPSEEAFQAAAARLKDGKGVVGRETGGRKSKRTKR
ncbi:hypothetical protein G7Y89_g2241 [Cudoniella acicularis]|uniref:J domain-containing protein n=1 Tax=Cudoniella acicularis TaxID=354080 RepID=A0A8H4RTT4_9HELO|nr:hypothetical protein G7Y89_g2241 [Cudoniella acicularis]